MDGQLRLFEFEVTDWCNRVVANGGDYPLTRYKHALNDFVIAMKNDGLWAKMIMVNAFVPGTTFGVNPPSMSCVAPVTPLIVGPGSGSWVTTGNASVTGSWPVQGSTVIDINGIVDFTLAVGNVPQTIWTGSTGASATNVGWTLYLPDLSVANVAYGYAFGSDDFNTPHRLRSYMVDNTSTSILDCGGNDIDVNLGFNGGYWSYNRNSTTSFQVFYASSTQPHTRSLNNTTSDTTDPRSTLPCFCGGANSPAGNDGTFRGHYSYCAIHPALSITDSQNHFNNVQRLRKSIGGGYA